MSVMHSASSVLPTRSETVAELRQLYRAAEARAARMRLVCASGRELTEAEPATIAAVLQRCADRLAYFLGRSKASVELSPGASGFPIPAPGSDGRTVGSVIIDGIASPEAIGDPEDREALDLHLELMGATIDRIDRERERTRLLKALTEREQRLEYIVGRMFNAQEEERRRVSHELHDGVAQTATALARTLEGAGAAHADLPAAERARLADVARGLVKELRSVIGGLRPMLLDDLGLEAGLRTLAEGLRDDGFAVDIEIEKAEVRRTSAVETALFRVAQEAVTNIRKHAGGPCRVRFAFGRERGKDCQVLRIRDFGRGCALHTPTTAPMETGAHIGIAVMRERMIAIGGELEWGPGRGGGVSVVARLPHAG